MNVDIKFDKDGRLIIPDSFSPITIDKLIPFDTFLYYYGNKITGWHGEKGQKEKYTNTTIAPYHTNIMYDRGMFWNKVNLMDTEIVNAGSLLEKEYLTKKNIRIDVVRMKNIKIESAHLMAAEIESQLGQEAFYGIMRFASFAKRLEVIGWLFNFVKVPNKNMVCSGRVAKVWEAGGYQISRYLYNETIPNDILVWVLEHLETYDIYTLKNRGEIV